jgi:hemolysin III
VSAHDRDQALGEEIANAVSHGVGVIAAVAATPALITDATVHGTSYVVGASVFAATVVLLYLGSTLYHAFPRGTAKRVFHVIERSAIFLLIAGTYTPVALGVLRGRWGWTLIGIVWGLALLGVLLTTIGRARYAVLSLILYLGMGWLIVVAIDPLREHVPAQGLRWLVLGGVAYTAGVAFYAAKRLPYAHFVWHVFVLAGTGCHYMAVRFYTA